MNLRTVRALIFKYIFVFSRNTFRALDVFFWPVMDVLLWGFLTSYLLTVARAPALITFLFSAVILWNVLFRSQLVFSVLFLDDLYSRNLSNMFAAPVRKIEYIMAAYFIGLIQAVVIVTLMSLICLCAFSFDFFAIGFHCALFFVNLLIMGWSLGLFTVGLMLRWGQPAEALPWVFPFLLQPISAVFYPVSVLPKLLQPVAFLLPSAHVFEGMRKTLSTGQMDFYHFYWALFLNVVYMILSVLLFNYFFEVARDKGFFAKYAS
jgi:ABC-2 type transport system permease protein